MHVHGGNRSSLVQYNWGGRGLGCYRPKSSKLATLFTSEIPRWSSWHRVVVPQLRLGCACDRNMVEDLRVVMYLKMRTAGGSCKTLDCLSCWSTHCFGLPSGRCPYVSGSAPATRPTTTGRPTNQQTNRPILTSIPSLKPPFTFLMDGYDHKLAAGA